MLPVILVYYRDLRSLLSPALRAFASWKEFCPLYRVKAGLLREFKQKPSVVCQFVEQQKQPISKARRGLEQEGRTLGGSLKEPSTLNYRRKRVVWMLVVCWQRPHAAWSARMSSPLYEFHSRLEAGSHRWSNPISRTEILPEQIPCIAAEIQRLISNVRCQKLKGKIRKVIVREDKHSSVNLSAKFLKLLVLEEMLSGSLIWRSDVFSYLSVSVVTETPSGTKWLSCWGVFLMGHLVMSGCAPGVELLCEHATDLALTGCDHR